MITMQWPLHLNFARDDTCQNIFKPYIQTQLEKLKAYDALRPNGHPYAFDEHSFRVANDVKAFCLHLNLPQHVADTMYWAVLPHDIGKMALPVHIWDTEGKPDDALKVFRRTHTQTGFDLVQSKFNNVTHEFLDLMVDIMLHHHEKMDGTGDLGVTAEKLSLPVRVTMICDSFDGWSVKRPHFEKGRDLSVEGVLNRMINEKGASFFDMDLLNQYAAFKRKTPASECN